MDEWDALGLELPEEDKKNLNDVCDRLVAAGADMALAVDEIAALMRDVVGAVSECMGEILAQLGEQFRPPQRRKWPRPKNDRVKPLLLDRRPKLHRCRNNC